MKTIEIKRFLLTGSLGFIGTNLLEYMLGVGFKTLGIDIQVPQNNSSKNQFEQVDILDSSALNRVFVKFQPSHVVHLAARTDLMGKTLEEYKTNFKGVQSLIDAISLCDSVERCIFISSKLVCRTGYKPLSWEDYNPDTLYGQSKAEGEKIIRASNKLKCDWLIARPTSIWGPWFNIPYKNFFLTVAKGRYFHPGTANPPKSYGYAGNVVHQIMKLLEAPREAVYGKTFYLSDYEPYTIRDWANDISKQLHGKKIHTIPDSIMKIAAMSGDCLQKLGYKNPPMTSFRLNNMRADTTIGINMTPTKEICGSLPFTMEQGVEETLNWLREQKLIS